MAFRTVTWAGSNALNTTAASTPLNVPVAGGTGGLLAIASVNGGSGTSSLTGWPAGGTQVFTVQVSGSSDNVYAYWWPSGSTPASISLTVTGTGKSQGTSYRISGTDSWTPEASTAATGSLTSGVLSTMDPPALTPSWSSGGTILTDTTWMALAFWRSGTDTLGTYPTNYSTDQNALYTTAASGDGLALAFRQLTAASEDPGTFSLTPTGNRSYAAWTMAITQDASADTTPPAVPTGLTATAVYTA